MNYYRLLQVDLDGSAMLSDIRSLPFDSGTGNMLVWPNPAQYSISVSVDFALQQGEIVLINMEGKTVIRLDADEQLAVHQVDLEGLPPGLYQLVVTSLSKQWSERVVITD
jgi:hypothetical protein